VETGRVGDPESPAELSEVFPIVKTGPHAMGYKFIACWMKKKGVKSVRGKILGESQKNRAKGLT